MHIQRAVLDDLLDLNKYLSTAVLHRLGRLQGFQIAGLPLHGDVAPFVRIGASEESKVGGFQVPIVEILLAIKLDDLDEVLLGNVVELAALDTGIGKRFKPDACDGGPLCGDIAEHVRDDALRKIIGLKFVVQDHVLDLGRGTEMTTHDPVQQALMGQVVQTQGGYGLVSLSGGVHPAQMTGLACIQKAFFQFQEQLLGKTIAAHTLRAAGLAGLNQGCGLCRSDNLDCHDVNPPANHIMYS